MLHYRASRDRYLQLTFIAAFLSAGHKECYKGYSRTPA